MEANLQLVLSYFNVKRYLVNHTISFNNGHNRIDVLSIDLQNGMIYDCDVKTYIDGRMTESKFKVITRNLLDLKRELKINSIFNLSNLGMFKLQKVLITSPFVNQTEWLKRFETVGIIVYTTSELIKEIKEMKVNQQLQTNDAIINLINFM